MTPVIQARGLSKSYNGFAALKDATFTIPLGRIVGVIGSNGAGKTTLLNSILGLVRYDGELEVLGLNPATHRAALMRDVSFIADVATLPRWMRVDQVLDYVAGVHPRFGRDKALDYLARTTVRRAERLMVTAARDDTINPAAIRYANRLSDHLFVLARVLNDGGKGDAFWVPGDNR